MLTNNNSALIVIIILLVLTGCGLGDDGIVGTGFAVSGAANKGPFQKDSEVKVSVLDSNGDATTQTLLAYTKTDLGDFTFNLAEPGLVRIIVDGYQLNELTGNWSNSKQSLRGLVFVGADATNSAYVNTLTHITYDRIIRRLGAAQSVTETISQSEKELVTALSPVFSTDSVTEFSRLSVYNFDANTAEGNAYLLAVSATFYEYATVQARQHNKTVDAELALLLKTITEDFGDDGIIQNASLLSELKQASRLLRPDEIVKNLRVNGFLAVARDLSIANLDLFIDTDNDGVNNSSDADDDNDNIADTDDAEPYGQTVADIAILEPAVASVLSGTITVRGTANEITQLVKVKIGNGPFVEAEGAQAWSIQFNTREFGNVDTEIVVRAIQPDWNYVEKKIDVTIKNEKVVVVPIFLKTK